jgi:hypothetical protein
MRARTTSFRRSTTRVPITRVINFATSAVIACIGLLLSSSFLYSMVSGTNYHYMTASVILMIVGFVFGAPMLFGGLIGLIATSRISSSSVDNDISRIRHAVETESVRRHNV